MNSELNQYYIGTAVPNAPKNTGYVPNLMDPEVRATQAFRTFTTHAEDPRLPYAATFQQQATIRIHVPTPLNQAFFSNENIQRIQDEIRYGVYVASNGEYVIEPQNLDDLKTIMRSYYLQYSMNDPDKVQEELAALNKRVIAFAVDRVMVEIKQYIKYRKDILQYPDPISRPVNANITGSKSAEFKSFF
jgi:hypothetical protein